MTTNPRKGLLRRQPRPSASPEAPTRSRGERHRGARARAEALTRSWPEAILARLNGTLIGAFMPPTRAQTEAMTGEERAQLVSGTLGNLGGVYQRNFLEPALLLAIEAAADRGEGSWEHPEVKAVFDCMKKDVQQDIDKANYYLSLLKAANAVLAHEPPPETTPGAVANIMLALYMPDHMMMTLDWLEELTQLDPAPLGRLRRCRMRDCPRPWFWDTTDAASKRDCSDFCHKAYVKAHRQWLRATRVADRFGYDAPPPPEFGLSGGFRWWTARGPSPAYTPRAPGPAPSNTDNPGQAGKPWPWLPGPDLSTPA